MLTTENLILLIVISVLLINFQTILLVIIVYFYGIKDSTITMLEKNEIDDNIKEMILPYELTLFELGFEYQTQVSSTLVFSKHDNLQHSFYYYHPIKGVHALIDTTPIKGCLRPLTVSYITFYESQHMAISYDCFGHNIISIPHNIYLFDHYHGSFKTAYTSHLKNREIEGEIALREALNQEGLYNYTKFMIDETMENAIKENIMNPTQNGYKFSASLAFVNYVHRLVKGYRRAKKAIKENNKLIDVSQGEKRELYSSSEQYVLSQQLDEKPIVSSKESKVKIFLISVVTFVLFFGLIGIPWSVLPMIVLVLLIHELGHFWTMRYFGYKDTSIFFIPLFGAAAKGEKDNATPFEEYLVSLAGPLPGIIIAIAIGFIIFYNPELRDNELLKDYAMMSLFLNYINLLPIFPLDGGKIVQTLLFTRYPMAQFYFFLLSILVIIFSALMLQSILLGIFSVLLIFSLNNHYSTSKLIGEIMNQDSDVSFKQRVIERLSSHKKYQGEELITKVGMAKRALKILNAKKPTPSLMLFGLGFYLMIILSPLIIKIVLPL